MNQPVQEDNEGWCYSKYIII